ncbi:MAG TPA: CAP domain-containing protein, partial [Candidatus Limnocylindrales bacterium]|nr:CAP domain-containing protein [Candidatus Limnocylindrales bacterium]
IEGPFHRFAVFDPKLTEAGYGEAGSGGCWVAALRLPQPPPEEEKPYPRAIEFPPDRAEVALDWIGLEAPDPLESCPGYSRPVGLPITLQIGRLTDTKLTAHSLTEDGKPIEHCAFDADSYRNHIKSQQTFGHWNLRDAGAVVIVPRAPLHAGSRYSVSITAAGNSYAWSFKVADLTKFAAIAKFPTSPSPAPPMAEPTSAPSFSPPPPPIERHTRRATPAPEAMTSTSAPEEYAAARPTSKPTPEVSPAAAGPGGNWLTVLNRYRSRLNVPDVEEDSALSKGCLAHAKYLMRNYGGSFANIGILMHEEDESKPGYSLEGRKAAQASDVVFQSRNKMSDDQLMGQAVEWWISGPFHRGQLINPELRRVGFAQYCEGARCVSALNTTSDAPLASISGRPLAAPIEVPPDGATVKTPGFGGEWPSPVSSCPGYSTKSPAITLNLGVNVPAKITDAHLTQTTGAAAGTILDTCAYDSDGYTNPNAGDQVRGRQVLRSFGEVVMMVRDPLSPGESYRVAMTVNGKPYTWSFTAAP